MKTTLLVKYCFAVVIVIIGCTYTTSSGTAFFSDYRAYANGVFTGWGYDVPTPENAVSEGQYILEFEWSAPTIEQLDQMQNELCSPAPIICFVIVRSFGSTPISVETVRDGEYIY
jgi:hypothetical protein